MAGGGGSPEGRSQGGEAVWERGREQGSQRGRGEAGREERATE